jgi:hypothetical protein
MKYICKRYHSIKGISFICQAEFLKKEVFLKLAGPEQAPGGGNPGGNI